MTQPTSPAEKSGGEATDCAAVSATSANIRADRTLPARSDSLEANLVIGFPFLLQLPCYSITSSARTSTVDGTSRPSDRDQSHHGRGLPASRLCAKNRTGGSRPQAAWRVLSRPDDFGYGVCSL